jgi:osmotically-inducible protein OsmY
MPTKIPALTLFTISVLMTSCSNADKERSREQAQQAQDKAREEAGRAKREMKELAADAKSEAKKLNAQMNQALEGSATGNASGSNAEEKLKTAGRELKAAGAQAETKLANAALIAKVKSKIATDVGVTTVGTVNVDSRGAVVTLSGSVSSQEEKEKVQKATGTVDGVEQVINYLTVKP